MRLRLLPGLFLLRRLVRELSGIREQLAHQHTLLARLADYLAPLPPVVDRETVAADTGLSYVDPVDQALLLAYSAQVQRDTGHAPTDDELLEYLADEKTVDLHTRLVARDRALDRLALEQRR
jgi:hypothetical protein